jgi:type VI secretion system secreted protein VgrG
MRDASYNLLQALGGQRQNNRILRLSFPAGDGPDATLLVNALDASEGLSRPFDYTLELLSDDAHIQLKDLQGKMLCVELVRKDGTLRYFTGRVFRFGLKRVDGGLAFYEARLGPWLNYLSLRKDNYLFHEATLYDQARSIFSDYGALADWDWRVKGPDKPMTDACQFDETDANYLARRWAAAGLFYWFEHSESGHRLVLSDDSAGAAPIDGDPEVSYQRHGGVIEEDGIGDWSPVRQLVHGSVAVSSYDFKNGHPVVTTASTLNKQGDVPAIESYEYTGAFGFKNLAHGDALAKLRMEEIEARGKRFEGAGNNRQLMPGRWFRLTGHFDDEGGDDASEFLVVECLHRATNNYQAGAGTPHYENRLSCLRKKIPWRPGRGFHCSETRIYGIQTATVVGPRGEEIHTDEFGRVRVQFHWDREGQGDERSSAWIRVATPWAGSNFGMTSIPRIGTEVIVSFMDGNPDRPIVTGMIPNANTMPAWELPANKTQSGMLSRSTPGGGYDNANAIRFEDKRGGEQLWVQAERNMDTVVKANETRAVGNDRTLNVGRNHVQGIGNDVTHTVGGSHTETIKRNMTLNVTEGRQDSTIKGDVTVTSLDGEITVSSPHKITLVVGGSSITMTPDDITIVGTKIFLNP